jgi:tRNA wybutosine-synthesizing protein 4
MNYFYHKILDVSERKRVLWLEPFDEFEEWHLKCSHYVLIMSVKNMDLTLPVPQTPCLKSLPDGTETWDSFKAAVCVASNPLQRFGHASATSGDVLVFGGYGSDGIRHARLSCPILLRFGKTAGLVTS